MMNNSLLDRILSLHKDLVINGADVILRQDKQNNGSRTLTLKLNIPAVETKTKPPRKKSANKIKREEARRQAWIERRSVRVPTPDVQPPAAGKSATAPSFSEMAKVAEKALKSRTKRASFTPIPSEVDGGDQRDAGRSLVMSTLSTDTSMGDIPQLDGHGEKPLDPAAIVETGDEALHHPVIVDTGKQPLDPAAIWETGKEPLDHATMVETGKEHLDPAAIVKD